MLEQESIYKVCYRYNGGPITYLNTGLLENLVLTIMCSMKGKQTKVNMITKLINQKYAEHFANLNLVRLITCLLSINKHNFFLKSNVETANTFNWRINPCYKFFFDRSQLDEFKSDQLMESPSKRRLLNSSEEDQIRPLIKANKIKYIKVVYKDSKQFSYKCTPVCVCVVKALQVHSKLNANQIYEFINETYTHQFSQIKRCITEVLKKYPFFLKDEENFWQINSDYSIMNEYTDLIDLIVAAFEENFESSLSVWDVFNFIKRNYPKEKIKYKMVYRCLKTNACFIQINGKEKLRWIFDKNFKRINLQEGSVECFQSELLDTLLENDRYSHQEMVDINLFDLDEAFRE